MSFFKGKISTFSLDFFRIAIALLCIVHFHSIEKDYLAIYSPSGLVQPQMEGMLAQRYVPDRSVVLRIGSFMHMDEAATMQTIKWLYYIFLFFLLIGFITRFSALFCWLLHLILLKSAIFLSYGVDYLTTIALVYCILLPVAKRFSVDKKLFKTDALTDIFYLRILQIHVCIIYFFAGFAKALGINWWNGICVWRLLMRRPLSVGTMEFFAGHMFILAATGIIFILMEMLYAVFIWGRRTRWVMLSLAMAMHLFIGIFMGLYYFAAIMIIFNLAAFAFKGER